LHEKLGELDLFERNTPRIQVIVPEYDVAVGLIVHIVLLIVHQEENQEAPCRVADQVGDLESAVIGVNFDARPVLD